MVIAAALCLGCTDRSQVVLHPVSGKVTFRGRPASGAMVVFHDVRPASELKAIPIPRAKAKSDGTFQLTCYQENDGAPAGEYRVTVVLPEAILPPDSPVEDPASGGDGQGAAAPAVDPESAPSPRDMLQERYADPQTSGLTATVVAGVNDLPAFALQ